MSNGVRFGFACSGDVQAKDLASSVVTALIYSASLAWRETNELHKNTEADRVLDYRDVFAMEKEKTYL